MALKGNLRDFSITQLLNLIHLARKTGSLTLEVEPGVTTLFFREGKLVHTTTAGQDGHLVGALARAGKLTEEQARIIRSRSQGQTDKELAMLLINAGQVCTSTERVYVPRSMMPRFAEALAERVSRLRLGPGIEPTTDVGPMIGETYRAKVEAHVADAVAAGAKILTGGRRPPQFEHGFYYEPTVLVDVDHSMRIVREETFGPAIPVMTYDTFDQAIELANDTEYGLGACLYTHDARKVRRFYEEVRAGTIWINDPLTDNYAGPFGGMKMSGLGRELGLEGIEEFWQTKHVHWDIEGGIKEWWYPY